MAASDRLTGTNLVVEFLPTGGTPGVDEKVWTSDFTSFSSNRQTDVVDVTAGNEAVRYEKATIEGLDFTVMLFDAKQSYQADSLPGATGKLSIYRTGDTIGEPLESFNCLVKSYNEDMPFDGALEIEISGSRIGAMIDEVGTLVT